MTITKMEGVREKGNNSNPAGERERRSLKNCEKQRQRRKKSCNIEKHRH